MREQLERLIQEMVEGGLLYEDALRVFERAFIAQVLARTNGNLSRAADTRGRVPPASALTGGRAGQPLSPPGRLPSRTA